MGHRDAAALLYRQAGLRAVQSLYLALLVRAEYDGVLGRIQIKPDYIGELLGKLWIVGDFETPRQMRLQTMSMPDTSHGGFAYFRLFRHAAGAPVRGVGGFARRGQLDDRRHLTVLDRSPASRPRCIFGKGFRAARQKPLAPPRRFFRRDAEFSGDFAIPESIGRAKDDTRALDQAGRKRPPARLLFQYRPILQTQIYSWRNAHRLASIVRDEPRFLIVTIYDALH